MAKLRLTSDVYVRPADFDNPDRDNTTNLYKGDVFDAGAAEAEHLKAAGAAEEFRQGDEKPDDAVRELAEAQFKRMQEEHDTLKKRSGITEREVKLSEDRVAEAERALERAKGKSGRGPRSAPVPPGTEQPPGSPEK